MGVYWEFVALLAFGQRFPVPACRYRLARASEWRMCEFNAQHVANTAWTFATVGQLDASLFTALARAAEWHICEFKAQELANTAWAFATADQLDASLFTALARASEWRMCEFTAQ